MVVSKGPNDPPLGLTLFHLSFLRVAQLERGGGGGAAYNSKTINDNEIKFGVVVKDH